MIPEQAAEYKCRCRFGRASGFVPVSGRIGSDRCERQAMTAKARAESRFDRWIERAGTPRSAALVIA